MCRASKFGVVFCLVLLVLPFGQSFWGPTCVFPSFWSWQGNICGGPGKPKIHRPAFGLWGSKCLLGRYLYLVLFKVFFLFWALLKDLLGIFIFFF